MKWSSGDTGIQIFVYEHTMPRLLKSRIALIHQGQVVWKVDITIQILIHWIVIYPAYGTIQQSNNQNVVT